MWNAVSIQIKLYLQRNGPGVKLSIYWRKSSMAKIKDIAGGFYNNNTIYSPNGYTQARKVANAIIDRSIADMQNDIQQGENIGAEARKNKKEKEEGDKASIAELTGNNNKKNFVKVSPLLSKKEAAAKQNKQNEGTKKETLVNPDTVPSVATAKPADNTASGTKQATDAKYGRKGNDPVTGPDLPEARPGLFDDQKKAEENLKSSREKRDEFVNTAKQDKKQAKRDVRDLSLILDDIDFEDEFDGTNPVIASYFKKGKLNKLLKDQIKEKYADKITEIAEKVENDPANESLSGREKRKLITEAVNEFIEPLWKEAGGDTKVGGLRLATPISTLIKRMLTDGDVPESSKRMLNDLRAATLKKQNKTVRDKLFLSAFDRIETDNAAEKKTAELKGDVKTARDTLTSVNREVKQHKKDVDSALNASIGTDRKTRVEHKNGFDFFYTSGEGSPAQYAAQIETKDGKKKYVVYSVTAGSPDTNRDPVWEFDYQEYNGDLMSNPNYNNVKNAAEGNLRQVVGGRKGEIERGKEEQAKKDFKVLDGQNYFEYRKAHKVVAPKILKLIIDRGGRIDAETGKIYSVSKDKFPENATQVFLDYPTALKLSKGDDEEVAKLTGMSLEEVKERRKQGMTRKFKLGDAHVTQDAQGRLVYQLQTDNITRLDGKKTSFYINWNNPKNRKVLEKYAKMGLTRQDIPVEELETVNTARSSEGNIDWTDKEKTKAAEKAQRDRYTGAYKPSADVLDALIGFGRKR